MVDPVSGSLAIILPFLLFWVSTAVNTVDRWDKMGKTNRLLYRLHTYYIRVPHNLLCFELAPVARSLADAASILHVALCISATSHDIPCIINHHG
jgi:hypothetical protein